MQGNFVDIQKPLNLNITVDSSRLKLPDELKGGIMNALSSNLDFCLVDDEGRSGAIFLEKKYMVSVEDGEMSAIEFQTEQDMLNTISVVVVMYRNFKRATCYLNINQLKKMRDIAHSKALPM